MPDGVISGAKVNAKLPEDFENLLRQEPGRPAGGHRSTSSHPIPPEVLEPVRRQRRVDRGAGDRPVPQPALDRPGVVPFVRKCVSAGVAQHVRVRLDLKVGAGRGALDHPCEARRGERRAALADEDKGRRRALALQPPESPHFVALDRVRARRAILTRRT